ncbi:MAG: hypothetical protein CMO81_03830 [Waddliaceae bacterium]|nr:hypothetical protein [Waddliaceae bacterium]
MSCTGQNFVSRLLCKLPILGTWIKSKSELQSMLKQVNPLNVEKTKELLNQGAAILDLRPFPEYGKAHIPHSYQVGVHRIMGKWASLVVPEEQDLILLLPDEKDCKLVCEHLFHWGIRKIHGYLEGGVEAWRKAGENLLSTEQVPSKDLYKQLETNSSVQIFDVRSQREWNAGHIAGAVHVPGEEIHAQMEKLSPNQEAVYVVCGIGYRSSIIGSILERAGFGKVMNVSDGMDGWKQEGLPLEY